MPPAPPNKETQTQYYQALLTVTGWTTAHLRDTAKIQGLPVRGLPAHFLHQRITARLYPRTRADGRLYNLTVVRARVAHPNEPNQDSFTVVGHLIRVDPSDGTLRIGIHPQHPNVSPFTLYVRGTRSVIASVNPEWAGVELHGSLIDNMMVLERAAAAKILLPRQKS